MKHIVIMLIVIMLAIAANTRIYSGGWAIGLAWDWGGVELIGEPGLFICPGVYDAGTEHFTPNPMAPLFPDLLTDC